LTLPPPRIVTSSLDFGRFNGPPRHPPLAGKSIVPVSLLPVFKYRFFHGRSLVCPDVFNMAILFSTAPPPVVRQKTFPMSLIFFSDAWNLLLLFLLEAAVSGFPRSRSARVFSLSPVIRG